MLELQSFKEGKVQLITLRSADREDVSYLDLSWKLQESLEKLNDEESTVVVLFDMSGINLQPRMEYSDSENCSISDLLSDIKFPANPAGTAKNNPGTIKSPIKLPTSV